MKNKCYEKETNMLLAVEANKVALCNFKMVGIYELLSAKSAWHSVTHA